MRMSLEIEQKDIFLIFAFKLQDLQCMIGFSFVAFIAGARITKIIARISAVIHEIMSDEVESFDFGITGFQRGRGTIG